MFYYEEGDTSSVTSPDVFVVKGIDKHDRRTYKLWEEGVAPCVVFEITSLNAILRPDGDLLRVLDPRTDKLVPTVEEAVEELEAVEAENARLRAELERLLRQKR